MQVDERPKYHDIYIMNMNEIRDKIPIDLRNNFEKYVYYYSLQVMDF